MATAAGKATVGDPCWTDLACVSLDRTLDFYGRLLGWEWSEPDESLGGYRRALVNGQAVCGVYSLGDEEQPAQWLTYLRVEDLDASLGSARAGGATTVMPALDLQDRARIGVVATAGHLMLGLCELAPGVEPPPKDHLGHPCWFEAPTPDLDGGEAFLRDSLGLSVMHSEDDGQTYATVCVGEEAAFGLVQVPAVPPVPAALIPYFLVEDVEEALSRLPDPAYITLPMGEGEFGRYAHLIGPDLEPFALFEADSSEGSPS